MTKTNPNTFDTMTKVNIGIIALMGAKLMLESSVGKYSIFVNRPYSHFESVKISDFLTSSLEYFIKKMFESVWYSSTFLVLTLPFRKNIVSKETFVYGAKCIGWGLYAGLVIFCIRYPQVFDLWRFRGYVYVVKYKN